MVKAGVPSISPSISTENACVSFTYHKRFYVYQKQSCVCSIQCRHPALFPCLHCGRVHAPLWVHECHLYLSKRRQDSRCRCKKISEQKAIVTNISLASPVWKVELYSIKLIALEIIEKLCGINLVANFMAEGFNDFGVAL
jgi:hypothetical protein